MRKLSTREQMAYRTIATLELERDEALGREAAGNNILAGQRTSLDVCAQQINTLQQRLTVAELREGELEGLLLQTNELLYSIQGDPSAVPSSSIDAMRGKVFTALKPAEDGEGS